MSLLRIENLSLAFGSSSILREVSFEVQPGEMLAVVGESGSGKSLTALSVLGLQPASAQLSGQVLFEGKSLLNAGEDALRALRGRDISMIFQEPMTALNPLHTIGKQIGEMVRQGEVAGATVGEGVKNARKMPAEQVEARVVALLEQVGLSAFKTRLQAYPHELSGGQRQRVMIAMAIANAPKLLIADEPTTAVDVTIQATILKLLKRLQKEMGMAMLFITHDLTLVRRLADRVVVMQQGQVVEQGAVSQLFTQPQHPYTQHLLASEPKGAAQPVPADAPIIMECQQLKVHFPLHSGVFKRVSGYIKAVDDISISIPKSSTIGIVGESGSGKTTLGFALLRLLKSQGRIVFMGKQLDNMDHAEIRALRARMQLVFQDPYSSLNPRMRVQEIIEEGLRVHHPAYTAAEREAATEQILQEVGLPVAAKLRYPHEFSGGQRQRISIARAMVLKPDLVVLDEPTSALDLSVQAQIIELLKRFQQERGISYVFISHDLRVVRAIAHRVVVMQQGQVVEQGDTAAIFTNPQHEYTKTLINAAFLRD